MTLFLAAHVWEHYRQVFPQNLGNSRAAALLSGNKIAAGPVKFAIIGDMNNGVETFESVVSRLREEKNVTYSYFAW